ncbi:kidins220b, partial [Symbiodinium sp. KB8]
MKVGRVLWALLSVSCTVQAEEAPPAVHHFEEGAVLHSQRWFSEEWRKRFNAADVVLEIDGLSDVWSVKQHLQSKRALSPFRLRLLHDGRDLHDDCAVVDLPDGLQMVVLPCSEASDAQALELISAAGDGNVASVEEILRRPQDPNRVVADIRGYPFGRPPHHSQTALAAASDEGYVEVVHMLLEAFANPDGYGVGRGYEGPSLVLAAGSGHMEVVRLLVEARALTEVVSNLWGTAVTPLVATIRRTHGPGANSMEIVEILLEAGLWWQHLKVDTLKLCASCWREASLEMVRQLKAMGSTLDDCKGNAMPKAITRVLVLIKTQFVEMMVVYCLQAYLPDATLHISFGPLAQLVEKLIAPLKNPATLRGQLEIGAFWNASRVVLGFEEMQAFDDHGEYASTAMVVDADTVIVTSPVAFKSLYGQVHGEVLSEMWVRTEDKMTWKIRSAMVALQDLGFSHSDGAAPATKTPEKQRDASADKSPPKPTEPPQPTNRPKETVLSGDLNNTMGANGTNGAAAVSKGHSTFLAGLA